MSNNIYKSISIITIDKNTNTIYIKFNNNKIIKTKEINANIDIDQNGNIVGVEILNYNPILK